MSDQIGRITQLSGPVTLTGSSAFIADNAVLKARIAELENELDIRKAAIEAQFELKKQVDTLTRSNVRLRQKLDRLTRTENERP